MIVIDTEEHCSRLVTIEAEIHLQLLSAVALAHCGKQYQVCYKILQWFLNCKRMQVTWD